MYIQQKDAILYTVVENYREKQLHAKDDIDVVIKESITPIYIEKVTFWSIAFQCCYLINS